MIETVCSCGQPISAREAAAPGNMACPACRHTIHLVTAERLGDGAGLGDFDAHLVVTRGPQDDRLGHVYMFGGVPAITVGKLDASHLHLPGTNVSRHHATLERVDFGPSRWRIVDNRSTNGLWVNGQRVSEPVELNDGDVIVVGTYELRFAHAPEAVPVMAAAAHKLPLGTAKPGAGPGRSCPSCGRALAAQARICVDCGIDISSGRPLITSRAFDENVFAERSAMWIRVASWLAPVGLFPIASEAFGTRKPIAAWTIATLTILVSLWFFFAHDAPGARNLMLWSGDPAAGTRVGKAIDKVVEKHKDEMSASDRRRLERLRTQLEREERAGVGEFHYYQLLTHALLHGGLLHLAGNLLFFFVLGSRVNSLIGNVQTAIVYPLLAVASGLVHHLATAHEPYGAALGASGAIMGLAGMYLVLFPVNRVHVAAWFRLAPFLIYFPVSLIFLFRFFFVRVYKVFTVRGVYVVLFFIAFDVWDVSRGNDDGVAHWAHLGGFLTGVLVAVLLLVTRLANARGGDLISVLLGRHAWKILGKPSTRGPVFATVEMVTPGPGVNVTSLNFPD